MSVLTEAGKAEKAAARKYRKTKTPENWNAWIAARTALFNALTTKVCPPPFDDNDDGGAK